MPCVKWRNKSPKVKSNNTRLRRRLYKKNVFGIGKNFNQFSFTIGEGMGFGQLSDRVLKDKKVKFENSPEFLQKDIRARVEGQDA